MSSFIESFPLRKMRCPYCPLNILLSAESFLCCLIHLPFILFLESESYVLTQVQLKSQDSSLTFNSLMFTICTKIHFSIYFAAGQGPCHPPITLTLTKEETGVTKKDLFIFLGVPTLEIIMRSQNHLHPWRQIQDWGPQAQV